MAALSLLSSRSAESEQRLDSHARLPGLVLVVLLHLHEFPLALAELLLRHLGRRRAHCRSARLFLLLEHPQGLDDVAGLFGCTSSTAAVLGRVDDGEVGEAGFGWSSDVGEVAEVGEEVATPDGLWFGVLVVIGASATGAVVERTVGGLVDAVLVVLLILRVVGAAGDDAEVARAQERGFLIGGGGYGVGTVALEVAQEAARTVALLLVLVFGEGETVVAEQLGEGGEEVLAVGLQALLLGLGFVLRFH